MQVRLLRLVSSIAGSWLLVAAVASADDAPKVYELSVKAEPLTIMQGQPLSVRALVTHPAPLGDAISWTIESKKHRGGVLAMARSPDGKKIATAGVDAVVRVWDLASGELLRAMSGHNYHILGLAWSPDGKVIASAGGWDHTMRLWDADTGMPLRTFKSEKGYCYHIAFSRDGSKLLAAGGTSGWVWLWDARTDEAKVLVEVGQHVYSIGWAPDGERYAVTSIQSPVSVYELSSAKAVEVMGEPTVVNYCVRWSPDGTRLAVGSAGELNIYEMPGAKPLQKIKQTAYSVAWSPDGKLLLSAASPGSSVLWVNDASTGKMLRKISSAGSHEVIWPEADTAIARGLTDLAVIDPLAGTQKLQRNLGGDSPPVWTPTKPIVTGVGEQNLALWDNNTARALRTLEGHKAAITGVAWSRDGKTLVSSSYDKTLVFWEAGTGKRAHEVTDGKASVTCVAFSPDGKTLAAGGGDNQVRLFSAAAKPLGALQGHSGSVDKLAWSPRGNLLASGGADSTVRIWNAAKQVQLHEMPSVLPVESMAFSPDGELLAAGTSDDAIQSWVTATGQALNRNMRITGSPRIVSALGWSPDSSLLLAGRGNYRLQLWSWAEPKLVYDISVYAPVKYVAFAAGGGLIVSGSADRTTRFINTASSELVGSIINLGGQVLLLTAEGNYRVDTAKDPEFVYIVQTAKEQALLKPADFTSKYKWRNALTSVKFNR